MRILAATGLALVLAFAPAMAEDQIPAAKLAVAKELIQVSGADAIAGSPELMTDMMVAQVKKIVPDIDAAAIAEIRTIVREEFAARMPVILEESAKIYARRFSEAEMADMIAFYKSPTGKRVVAEMPALMQECTQLSADLSSRIVQRFAQYVHERAVKESKKDTPAK